MKKLFILTLLWISLTGCDFSDVNIDPNQKSSVEPGELLPFVITQSAYNSAGLMARSSGFLMQYWDQQDISIIVFPYYRITSRDFNSYWNVAAYGGVLNTCNSIITLANEQGELQYAAVAKILMARELGTLTSSFGDVPYSRAFDVTLLKVPYDTQEEVYSSIQLLLDEAITTLEESAAASIAGDLIFQGESTKWIQTAHALKARYYMHLTRRDAEASTKALEEINLAFSSNFDQPDFKFGSTLDAANPLAKYAQERPQSMIIHENLSNGMTAAADPRITAYMYFNGNEYSFYNYDANQGLFWSINDAPMPLISFTELKFLEAEAMLRNGNLLEAELSMQEAVRSSMSYLGIDAIAAELYLSSQVNFINHPSTADKLQKIIEEKYVSLYFQGAFEVWVDYRRTGFPILTPYEFGENELNPGGQIPQRWVYVSNEYSTNQENVKNAASNIGGDLLSTKLWAFK